MKEFCMLSNLCGDTHCCNYCTVKACDIRCLDDSGNCKYSCLESDVPKNRVVKQPKQVSEKPVFRRRRRK